MLERLARIIDPDMFVDNPGHNQGECGQCDANRDDARGKARAVMDELWSRIDLALLDFPADDQEGFARGHEHAKSVVREILRTASIPNEEGEGK